MRLHGLSNAPPPVYNLSSDSANLTWPDVKEWTTKRSAIEVALPWDDMDAFDAYADLTDPRLTGQSDKAGREASGGAASNSRDERRE